MNNNQELAHQASRAVESDYKVLDEEGFKEWKLDIEAQYRRKDNDVMYYLRRQSIPVRVANGYIGIAPCRGYGLYYRLKLGTDMKYEIARRAKKPENAKLLADISDELDSTVAFFKMLMRGKLCSGVNIKEGVLTRQEELPSHFFLDFPRTDENAIHGGDAYKCAFQILTSANSRKRLHLSGACSFPLKSMTIFDVREGNLRRTPLSGITHLDLLRAAAVVFRLCPAHVLIDVSGSVRYAAEDADDHFILTPSFIGYIEEYRADESEDDGNHEVLRLSQDFDTSSSSYMYCFRSVYLNPSLFPSQTTLLIQHHLRLAHGRKRRIMDQGSICPRD